MTLKGQEQKQYGERTPAYCYDIDLLYAAYLRSKFANFVDLARAVKEQFGEKAVEYREIHRILKGERRFPRPSWVNQIAFILNVSMDDLITTTKEAA